MTTDPLKQTPKSADDTTVDVSSRTPSPADRPDERTDDTPESLITLVRERGLNPDAELVERIDRAIGRAREDRDLGILYLARALALQGRGNASAPAAAVRNAIPHLVAAEEMESAAFAAAMAAVFLDQTGESIAAIDHAVDALVMLGDTGSSVRQLGIDGVRAALALSGFFMRISAFHLAVESAARAFQSAQAITGIPLDTLAYSVGYVSVEGAHVADEETTRAECVAHAVTTIEWLEEHGVDDVSRVMLADGLRAETLHALGSSSRDLELDAAADLYDAAAPDLVAWHRLVRGQSAHLRGDHATAITLFDAAIPGLEASADDHCVVRALRGRAEARAAVGDLAGAYADSADLAARTRRWQISQVGRLAFQLARRADLERSTTELQRTAARLADDIDNDATTGVNSRRWLERRLDDLAKVDGCGSALMCDIDRFKNVNDTYGHHIGDDVLREFGGLLHDVAGDGDIARFGGEEFVVVLSDTDEREGLDTAERLREVVEQHDWTHIAPDLHLTISCGVAHGELSEVRALLVAADEALLDAKHGGRNLVRTPVGSVAS